MAFFFFFGDGWICKKVGDGRGFFPPQGISWRVELK